MDKRSKRQLGVLLATALLFLSTVASTNELTLVPRRPVSLNGPIESFERATSVVIVLGGVAQTTKGNASGGHQLPFVGSVPFSPADPPPKPFFGDRPPVSESTKPFFGSRPEIQPPTDPTTQQLRERHRQR